MFNLLRLSSVLFLLSLVYSCGDLKKLQTKSQERTRGSLDTFKVVYDFETKMYDKKLIYPRIDHPTVFVIENINRLAYDVSIESKDSSLMEASSTDFIQKVLMTDTTKIVKDISDEKAGNLVTPESLRTENKNSNTQKDTANKLGNANGIIEDEVKRQITLSDIISSKESELNQKRSVLRNLDMEAEEKRILNERLKGDTAAAGEQKKIEQELLTLEKNIKILSNEVELLQTEVTPLKAKLNTAKADAFLQRSSLKTLKNKIISDYYKIESIKAIHNKIIFLLKNPHLNFIDAQEKIKVIMKGIPVDFSTSFKDSLNAFFIKIQHFKSDYAEFVTSTVVKEAYAPYIPMYDVKPFLDVVNEIDSTVKKNNFIGLVDDIYLMISNLQNKKNFQIVSAPIQPKRDMILFDVKIKSKDSSGKYINDNRSFRYHDYVRGGIRYDFSTGIALNLGLNNESYRLVTIPGATDSVEIVKNKDRNAPTPQIAALFHTSIRTKTLFRTGFTLGTTLNTADFNITTVFIGFSAMFGRSEKYILTAGTALKRTNVLAGKYDVGQRFNSGAISEAILTEQTWKAGPFISFSYNLTQKQKQ